MGDMKKNIERIEKEICAICNKEPMSPQDIDNLKDLADAYAHLTTSVGMVDFGQYMYGDESSLSSFRRGRSPYTGQFVSRDQWAPNSMGWSMGHPMNDSYGNYSMNSPAYAGGYSGHSINDRMIASLEHMMSQTNDKYEQEQIRNEIESIRKR